MTFSERVQRRYALFWRIPRLSLHTRGRCQRTYLSREAPPEQWHCCPYWQRKLSNKWNSREFAQKHGCAVPDLYWSGSNPAGIPFDKLPDQYVVRSAVGHSRQGVLVLDRGRNLLDNRMYSPSLIRETMQRCVRGFPRGRVLVEAFVAPEPGSHSELPRDYKFHVFGGEIGSICVIERGTETTCAQFDEFWTPQPKVRPNDKRTATNPPPPACLDGLRSMARTLGTAFGSYARIDLYAGPRGALFGEFTATPTKGLGYTEFADRLFGELWERTYPGVL